LGEIRILCDVLDDAEKNLQYKKREPEANVVNLATASSGSLQTDAVFHRAIPVQLQERMAYTIEQEEEKENIRLKMSARKKTSLKVKEFPPSLNFLFTKTNLEFTKIRNCCFGRKDILLYIDLKRQKQESKRINGFFKGVEKALNYSC
jgi:hypothetical protein